MMGLSSSRYFFFYLSHGKFNMPTSNRIHIIQALAQNVQEKESIISVRYGGQVCPSGQCFGITRQSLVMPNSEPWDRFVHPHLTPMSDSYNTTWRQNVGIEHYNHRNS